MLEKFRAAKQAEIAELARNGAGKPFTGNKASFMRAIARPGFNIIAEYKRASPSRGIIRADLPVETVASEYYANGAAAMSVLTEKDWFQGDLAFLARAYGATDGHMPLLRKDFIFHPLQIEATAATPASALLLIARMLEDAAQLSEFIVLARKLGLDAVVEIFDMEDLRKARQAGASIIQVNARDLDTLAVSRAAALKLIAEAAPRQNEIWIAASGISCAGHAREAARAGFRAALVGTALMAAEKPGAALAQLAGGCANAD